MKTLTACQHGVLTELNRGFNKESTDLMAAGSLSHAIQRNTLFSSAIVSAAVLSIGLLLSSAAKADDACVIQEDGETVICTYDQADSFTFEVPTGVGVSEITIELWGAGGGGADGKTTNPSRGGPGGGGGGYLQETFSVNDGDEFDLVVGAGGGGGGATDGAGANGGDTIVTFSDTDYTAGGGAGGGAGGSDTAGGAGGVANGGKDGGSGGGIEGNNNQGGGGGSSPWSDGDAQDGTTGNSGGAGGAGHDGESDGPGAGGNGGLASEDAGDGQSPGGGGGGGSTGKTPGADGADGQIIITFTATPQVAVSTPLGPYSVNVGDTITLEFVALDALGEVVVFNPDPEPFSYEKESENGGEVILENSPTLDVTGVRAGTVMVTASADGFEPVEVEITVLAIAPGPPQNVSVVPGIESLIVSWDPPASDGGALITSYTASINPSCETDGETFTCTINTLTPGEDYVVEVIASNGVFDSDPAVSLSSTPLAPSNPDPEPEPNPNPNPELTPAPVPVPTLGLLGLLLLISMMGFMVTFLRYDSLQTLRSS